MNHLLFPPPAADTLCTRFAASVARSPTAVAVDDGRSRLSYAELDQQAAAVAARLAQTPFDAPGRVAILAEDRTLAVAAMLGIARSGHAYVPLDAGDPDARLRGILEDSQPVALCVEPSQTERARALAVEGCDIITLTPRLLAAAPAAHGSRATPESVLYLFYTSGSTGQPKGVAQTHRNLLFFSDAYAQTLAIRPDDRLSLLYTLSFSAANMDIYGALLHGATLCPYDLRREGIAPLAAWLEAQAITILHTVPTVLRELGRSVSPSQRFPHIRGIDLGGETVFAGDLARFRHHVGPDCLMVNHLAATEASVIAQRVFRADDPLPEGALPVGISPEGVMVNILDADDQPVSPGETGRLVIDSPYLSPGYWNRPALNATVFKDVPERPGWRRYITQDLGRFDSHQQLHFMGRDGSHLKLRGHSIDLHEIEAALVNCDGVSEAVVLPHGEPGQEYDRLVAYGVMAADTPPAPLALRRQLADHLPSYMLPSGYVFMARLPHTATGKVDRLALQALDLDSYRADYQAPRDELECQVAAIFARLLRFEAVGRDDDFFLLGGDSMRMVDLQLALRQQFGHDLADLQGDATVARYAERLRALQNRPVAAMRRLVALRPQGQGTPLYLVHGRQGQAFVSPHFAALFENGPPLFALQAKGLEGREPPATTLRDMAEDYVRAIREHQPEGPYFLGGLCSGSYIAMEMADLLRAQGQQVGPLLLFDPPQPFSYLSANQSYLKKLLGEFRGKGQIAVDINNPAMLQASIRVAQAAEYAVRRYLPKGYRGPVFAVVSRRFKQYWTKSMLSRVFLGNSEFSIVGETHADALDATNPAFADAVRACLAKIRADIPPTHNLSALETRDEYFVWNHYYWWWCIRRYCGL